MSSWKTGTVEWFNTERGYGKISRENGPDLWVYLDDIARPNNDLTLEEGLAVEFEVVADSRHGEVAKSVHAVGEPRQERATPHKATHCQGECSPDFKSRIQNTHGEIRSR